MSTPIKKTIGLLVGDELDWPDTIEALHRAMGPTVTYDGKTYEIEIRRLRIDPFSLSDPNKYDLVIDRLAYWHFTPREWLKKAALVDDTYLLNNPFTFQSMEKHSAYCAMIRLGLHIPETWLIPQKVGPSAYQEKFRRTAERYHDLFDLAKIAEKIGYPLFMKPFDGGGWRDVTKITNRQGLLRAYDASNETLMHLQQGLDNYDVFTRSLAIGPQVINLKFAPEKPQHARYVIDHGFLSEEEGREVRVITKLINAFFRWDFNSCETIHKDGKVWPIDFANACPDIAVHSLHYYYPWAIKALYSWAVFCAVTERPMRIAMEPKPYFAVADSERTYAEKLDEYEAMADEHFQAEAFEAFRAESLSEVDGVMWDMVQTQEFDQILKQTIEDKYPPQEQSSFYGHFKGLLGHWVQSHAKHWGPDADEHDEGDEADAVEAAPKAAEPKAAEPKAAEPKAAEPKAAEPKAAKPKPAKAKAAKAKDAKGSAD